MYPPTSLDVVSNTLKALSRRSSSYTSGSNNHGGSSASGSSTSTPTSSASSSNASSTTTSPAWRTASELPILSGMSSSSSSSSSSEQDASTTTTGREATAGTIAHAAVGVTSPTTMVTSNASTTTVLSSMLLANQGSLVPPASHHHHHHHHSHHHRSRTGVVPSGAGMGIGIGASAGTGVGSSSSASSSLIMRSDKPSLFRNKDWSSLSRGEGGSDGGGSTDVIPAGADVDEGLVQKKYQQEDELVLAQSSVTTTTIATIESGEAATAATSSLSSASRQSKERARKFVLSSAWSHLSSSKAESNATAETTAAASVSPPTTTTPPLSTSAIARSLLSLSTAGSALLPTHGTNVAANNMSSPSTSASPTSLLPHAQSSYKAYFKRRYMIDRNWISGDHSLISYTTPETGVVTSLQFDHHHIVVGCDNSRIQIFETTTGRLVRTLQGHLGGVWALEFIKGVVDPTDPYRSSGAGDKILVSGGCDREVRVWDMTTGVCRQVMSGHTGTIRCLKIYKFDRKKSTSSTPSSPITSSATPSSSIQYLAVTGSRDATLRVWDIQTGQKKFLLHGHRSSVRCIEIHGDLLVSGSYDCTARVWSLITGECLLVLQGHFQQIYSIAFNGEYIITGSLDSTCRLWSPVTGACLATLQGHTQLVGQLQLSGDSLMTGGGDGFMYLWNLKTFECQYRVQAHDLSVTSLCFDSKRIVTGGNDGAVKLWDRLTGKFIRLLTKTDAMIWRVAICEERVVICMQKNGRTAMEVMCFDSEAPLLGSPGSTSQNLDLLSNTTLSSLASASPSSSSRSSAATPVAAHQLYHLQQQQQHVSESASEQPHPQWSLDDGSSALSAFDSLGV
ncbi:hypothetical protein BGZ83_011455 [Gryganskiella cystojenkinii]|nr:hypothetical protein BGZ83_011455 [Gryganskiella cystojenkinii]